MWCVVGNGCWCVGVLSVSAVVYLQNLAMCGDEAAAL